MTGDEEHVWEIALGQCWCCGRLFGFEPERVASVPIDPDTNLPPDIGNTPPARAVNMPVCPACVEEIAARRAEIGQPSTWTPGGWR